MQTQLQLLSSVLPDPTDLMRVWLGDAALSWAVSGFAAGLGVNVNESLHLLVLSFPGPHQENGFSCLYQVI